MAVNPCTYQNKIIKELDKLQAKFIKCLVRIGSSYKTTPLLKALKIHNISDVINLNSLVLFKNIMKHPSAARRFNMTMINKKKICLGMLVKLCNDNNLNLLNLIFQGNIVKAKCQLLPIVHDEQNGTVDTLRMLLRDSDNVYWSYEQRMSLVKLLLKAF